MLKPTSLRQALAAAIPDLRDHPDHLRLTTESGRIVSTLAATLSFEAQYQLQLIVSPFTGELEEVVVPLLAWLRVNQPDLMPVNPEQPGGFSWQLATAADGTPQLTILIPLTERALVSQQGETLHATWVQEPPEPAAVTRPVELWMKDELVSRQPTSGS